MSMPKSAPVRCVAIVDDEATIRDTVEYALQREGYRTSVHANGADAWDAFQKALPDLVILDILMPRMDGLELCRRLRALSDSLPIIFLTSRDEEFDRVLGLELGADDYLCKPFSMRELIARVKVLFRRLAFRHDPGTTREEALLRVGDLCLDLNRYAVHWGDVEVALTVTEFRILAALVRNPGHVKSRAQLLEEGYPDDTYVSERTVDSHIKRLRRKFDELAQGSELIETVYGLGYRYGKG
jgi:two-component system response regulator ChvI